MRGRVAFVNGSTCEPGLALPTLYRSAIMGGMEESPNAHPLNAAGDFYVVNDLCMACSAPELEAPTLMAHSDDQYQHCYFKRQPQTPQETESAIRAVTVSCCRGLRYGGRDQQVIARLMELGSRDSCDFPKIRRRSFRFSLRTMLALVFVLAVLMAGVRYYLRPDLVITDITFTPAVPKVGEGVQITIFYRNRGRKDHPSVSLYQSEPIARGYGGGGDLKAGETPPGYLWGGVTFTRPGRHKFVFYIGVKAGGVIASGLDSLEPYTAYVDVVDASGQ